MLDRPHRCAPRAGLRYARLIVAGATPGAQGKMPKLFPPVGSPDNALSTRMVFLPVWFS